MLTIPIASPLSAAAVASSVVLPTADTRAVDPPSSHKYPNCFLEAADRIIIAAKDRWPRFGPWQVLVTYREDGSLEWMLRGRSWKIPDVGDKARIARTLAELEQRVCVDRDN